MIDDITFALKEDLKVQIYYGRCATDCYVDSLYWAEAEFDGEAWERKELRINLRNADDRVMFPRETLSVSSIDYVLFWNGKTYITRAEFDASHAQELLKIEEELSTLEARKADLISQKLSILNPQKNKTPTIWPVPDDNLPF
jgi:hypothetical protein